MSKSKKVTEGSKRLNLFDHYLSWVTLFSVLTLIPISLQLILAVFIPTEEYEGLHSVLTFSIIFLTPINMVVLIGLLLAALERRVIKGAFRHDLQFVGFYYPTDKKNPKEDATSRRPNRIGYKNLRLTEPLTEKTVNRVRAFLSYGFYSLMRSGRLDEIIIRYDGTFEEFNIVEQIDNKILQVLTWDSILLSNRIIRKQKLDRSINPTPLAAYLFRMSVPDNDARNKLNQEKALTLWTSGVNLENAYELHEHSLEEIKILKELPTGWTKDVSQIFKEEW